MSEDKLTEIIGDGEYDMFEWGWVVEPDPDYQLSTFLCSSRSTKDGGTISAGLSDTFYCNPAYDALYDQQATTTDPKARADIVKQMQKMLYDDAPYVVTYYYANLEAYRSDRFTNFQPQPDPKGSLLFQYGTYSYRYVEPVDRDGTDSSTQQHRAVDRAGGGCAGRARPGRLPRDAVAPRTAETGSRPGGRRHRARAEPSGPARHRGRRAGDRAGEHRLVRPVQDRGRRCSACCSSRSSTSSCSGCCPATRPRSSPGTTPCRRSGSPSCGTSSGSTSRCGSSSSPTWATSLHGDLGISFKYRQPVTTVIADRIWPTLLLVGISTILATVIGLWIGIRAAWSRDGTFDRVTTGVDADALLDARVLARHDPHPGVRVGFGPDPRASSRPAG